MTKREQILEEYYKDPNVNRAGLARKLNTDERYVRRVIKGARKNVIDQGHEPIEETIDFNNTSRNSAKLELKSLTITTLEQALEVAEVDMTQWKVDRYTIGSWQVTLKIKEPTGQVDKKGNEIYIDRPQTVTMYKIQVWLNRLHNMEWVEAVRDLIHLVPQIQVIPEKDYDLDSDYLLEIAMNDVHYGMLAWGKETIHDYDLDVTDELFLFAVKDLLSKAKGYKPKKILFPLGNDFLHIDDPTNLTPQNRNPLDADSRLIKIYKRAKMGAIKAINYCRSVAPVEVTWVPGNHDPNVSYYLCDVISEVFAGDDDVTVDTSPKWRKFHPWGEGLIVFTHGVEEPIRELPNICMTEEPLMWGQAKYREIHIGHKHKKMEMRWINVDTNASSVVRMIPSIATEDAWHYRKGYIKAFHAAEAYLWDAKYGMIGQFTTYIDYNKIERTRQVIKYND